MSLATKRRLVASSAGFTPVLRCVRSGGNTSQLRAVADERVSGEDQQCD